MKTLFTIGFTKKTAEQFFNLLYTNHVRRLIDVRLSNNSQLAGFAKGIDLKFFLETFYGITYEHDLIFAPTTSLFDRYRAQKISWEEYVEQFDEIMDERDAAEHIKNLDYDIDCACLLCSEESARNCHRRLVAELIADTLDDINIEHLGDPLWNEISLF